MRPQLFLAMTAFALSCAPLRAPFRPKLEDTRPWESAAELTSSVPLPSSEEAKEAAQAEKATAAAGPQDERLRQPISLRAEGTDLRSMLLGFSKETGININVGNEVKGTVSAYFTNVPVADALTQILKPLGFAYKVEKDFVTIYKPVVETRIFKVDYLLAPRKGSTTATISEITGAASGGGGGAAGAPGGAAAPAGGAAPAAGVGGAVGGGGGGAGGSGTSNVNSTWEVDFWKRLQDELAALVFGTSKEPPRKIGEYSAVDANGHSVLMNPLAGSILVRALPETLDDVERYLNTVQQSIQRQVVIEARILEVSLTDDYSFGIDFQNLPGSIVPSLSGLTTAGQAAPGSPAQSDSARGTQLQTKFGTITSGAPQLFQPAGAALIVGPGGKDWQALIGALEGVGDVHVISAPRVTALSNQKAMVKVVRERVFFLANPVVASTTASSTTVTGPSFTATSVPEGVLVDVVPHISDDGVVTMEIHPSFTQVVGVAVAPNPSAGSQPEVERREIETTVRVKSGQTVALGGLMSETTSEKIHGIPLLMDIPGLGWLFRQTVISKTKTELIVLLTPRVQGPDLTKEYIENASKGR